MTATGKNVYNDVLDDVVNKYNNTKYSTIKIKPIDVGDNNKRVYIDEHNEKDSRFKVGDRIRISKFKNIFAKGYTPNWSSEIFIVDKINDTVPYTYNLKDLNADTIKYNYKGYGICFDESEEFTHVRKRGNFNDTTTGRNVIIFGVDMSFSKHANNKANNIYVMGKDYIQKINDTKIYAEKMCYRNFTDPGKKIV